MYDRLSRYYDAGHAALTEDIPFVLALAAEAGGPVLELGCGSGRLLLPLARAGYDVTGIDNSPAMLALAQQRLEQEDDAVRDRVRLFTADIASPYLPDEPATVALAVVGINTLMHLNEAQVLAALRNVASLLRPDGMLYIDMDNPLTLAAVDVVPELALEQEWMDTTTGMAVRQWAAYRPADTAQAVDVTWVFEEWGLGGSERIQVEMRYYYYYPHQMDLLLRQDGLRLAALLGDYDRTPFSEESDRLIVLANPA